MTIFHLSVGFNGPTVSASEIQGSLPSGAGWARYAPNCWIIQTNSTADEIAKAVRAKVNESDSVFVVELNLKNNYGFLNKEIWNWINERQ